MIYYASRIIMKNQCRILAISCLMLACSLNSLLAQENDEYDYFDPQTWLLGDFTYNSMLDEPHGNWFSKEFRDYELDEEAFIELEKSGLGDIDITVVMGTWCSDSRREVPRFMKIIETLGYDKDRIRFIGVDSYKEAPITGYDSLNIERVPTFIFYKNKFELGRIIEYPEASLEKDMLKILIWD